MKYFKHIDLSKIKVLSFDLDNTIYDCQTVLTKAEDWFTEYLCNRYGLGGECLKYDFWAQVKSEVLHENWDLADDVTRLREESLVEAFKRLKIPLKGGIKEASELVSMFVEHRSRGVVHPEIYELMDYLKSRYPLIAVSNGNLNPDAINVTHYFERDIRPSIGGLHRKPFKDMFIECARYKNVKIDEILHIGDDPFTDVYGAVNAGCKCAWVYKGYTGISPDESHLKVLPDILLDNVLELKNIL